MSRQLVDEMHAEARARLRKLFAGHPSFRFDDACAAMTPAEVDRLLADVVIASVCVVDEYLPDAEPGHIGNGSWDLAVCGIETVDVEIREVIAALNRLPCVVRTWHSCAGFGLAGTAPRNPQDHPADDPTGHGPKRSGYVSVEYDADSDWRPADDRLRKAFDWGGLDFDHHRASPNNTKPGSLMAVYRISRRDPKGDAGRLRSDEEMRAAWAAVLDAVLALEADARRAEAKE